MQTTQAMVNGKTLVAYPEAPMDLEIAARRLLAYDDAVEQVDILSYSLAVWIEDSVRTWQPPVGFEISSVSFTNEFSSSAMGVFLDSTEENDD